MESSAQSSDTKRKVKKLLEIRHGITSVLNAHDEDIRYIQDAKAVDTEDLIAFANSISHSLRAPKMWTPAFPLIGGGPPAPMPEQMRAGTLAAYNNRTNGVDNGRPRLDDADKKMETKIKNAELSTQLPETEEASLRKRKAPDGDRGSSSIESNSKVPPKQKRGKVSYGIDSSSEEED